MMSHVRLDPTLKEKIQRLAAVKGLTYSEVSRHALTEYCDRELVDENSFYESIFGAIEGPQDMAVRSGEIYKEVMDEKYRPRSD